MCRFPVVEHLVAILYWRIECGETVGKEENVEGSDWSKEEWAWRLPLGTIAVFSKILTHAYVGSNLTVSPCPTKASTSVRYSSIFSLVGIVRVIAPDPCPTLAGVAG